MTVLENGWIYSDGQIAHASSKRFLCGYTSCRITDKNLSRDIEDGEVVLKHPDDIPILAYRNMVQKYHDGDLFNEAIRAKSPALFSKIPAHYYEKREGGGRRG